MTNILAIETATKVCSVALFSNDKLVDCIESNGSYSHAENLAVFTENILKNNDFSVSDLDAISISKGPGSYTGLRIGVAFAKGLCYSNNIPLIAINTLDSLAWGAASLIEKEEVLICPMLDARRMEVYSALFNKQMEPILSTNAVVIDQDSFSKFLEKKEVFFIGDGAEKCSTLILHQNANFNIKLLSSAKHLGSLSYQFFLSKTFENIAYFDPLYLKEFAAIKAKKLL